MPPEQRTAVEDGVEPSVRRKMDAGRDLGYSIVVVIVGNGDYSKRFPAHQALLKKHSNVFKTAMSGSWAEPEIAQMTFPQQKPEFFDLFYRFIYHGGVFTAVEDGADDAWELARLFGCWQLGQKLLATPFKDAVLDCMVEKVGNGLHPMSWQNRETYASIPRGSTMRSFIVDLALNFWKDEDFDEDTLRAADPDFFTRIIAGCSANGRQPKGSSAFVDCGCKYHEHVAEGTPCYKTMF